MSDRPAENVPLQSRVGDWHRRRFPDAEMHHVALKGAEEMGEVAQAVNGVIATRSAATARASSVPEEAADVVICMMVLLDRWVPGADLLAEVEKKLKILTDPSSGHRSAYRGGVSPYGLGTEKIG